MQAFVISPESSRLSASAICFVFPKVAIWDRRAQHNQPRCVLAGPRSAEDFVCTTLSADGHILYAGGRNGRVACWDLRTGKQASFGGPSTVRLIRSLVPPLLNPPAASARPRSTPWLGANAAISPIGCRVSGAADDDSGPPPLRPGGADCFVREHVGAGEQAAAVQGAPADVGARASCERRDGWPPSPPSRLRSRCFAFSDASAVTAHTGLTIIFAPSAGGLNACTQQVQHLEFDPRDRSRLSFQLGARSGLTNHSLRRQQNLPYLEDSGRLFGSIALICALLAAQGVDGWASWTCTTSLSRTCTARSQSPQRER